MRVDIMSHRHAVPQPRVENMNRRQPSRARWTNGQWNAVWALAALLASSLPVAAQSPPRQPSYSPYLNLTRPGNLANNYYGLVRPEIDSRNAINNLQQRYYSLSQQQQQAANNVNDAEMPPTGRVASYQNYTHYYSFRNRAQGQGPAGGNVQSPPRRR